MAKNRKNRPVSEINVTPLVDVMLVLLIIFMVCAPMMKEGLEVDLPEAQARAIEGRTQDLVLTVTKGKRVEINGTRVGLDRLDVILGQIKEQRGVDNVYLQADKAVNYGFVVRVMGILHSVGLNHIGLVTQPESKKAG
ncbi:MAG: biopolymer transporter ExbD [Thermodesulfobacteriota bacterium]|nr:biopolymer transporter ExbD [Thermodesulfobacteriota bacterium]